ncbi:MAG: type II toxin-antitoxin system RelE/ParE family toxin [Candidatus Thiosymbion ectosymbiont of Robbea hypermnestra]|nr:type II toxin-antitoxin system RelE/ParE family toxin [Candidatus Thiosymbion ectosymbiont of Robbea hypermnestra]
MLILGGLLDLWFPGFGVEISPHHHGCPQITPIFTDYCFRILGFFDGNQAVILNHAFQKKSQKTPRKEVKIAENRKEDYLSRRQEP